MTSRELAERSVLAEYAPETLAGLWRRIESEDLIRQGVVAGLAVVAAGSSLLGAPLWLVVGAAAVGLVVGSWPIVSEACCAL